MASNMAFSIALILCPIMCQGVFTPHQMCVGTAFEVVTQLECPGGTPLDSNGCCYENGQIAFAAGCYGWSRSGTGQCTYKNCATQYRLKFQMSTAERWTAAHNVFRCMHGLNDVTWNTATAGYAKQWADTCVYGQHSQSYNVNAAFWNPNPRTDGGAGENLAFATGSSTPESTTQRWYQEINDYRGEAATPRATGVVGHYTALMWRSNGGLGCASCNTATMTASNAQGIMDVCQYSNGVPNVQGQYTQEVPQNNEPTASEDACCQRVYQPFMPTAAPARTTPPPRDADTPPPRDADTPPPRDADTPPPRDADTTPPRDADSNDNSPAVSDNALTIGTSAIASVVASCFVALLV